MKLSVPECCLDNRYTSQHLNTLAVPGTADEAVSNAVHSNIGEVATLTAGCCQSLLYLIVGVTSCVSRIAYICTCTEEVLQYLL